MQIHRALQGDIPTTMWCETSFQHDVSKPSKTHPTHTIDLNRSVIFPVSFQYRQGNLRTLPAAIPAISIHVSSSFYKFYRYWSIFYRYLSILIDILRIRCFVCPLWQKIGSEHSEHCNSGYSPNGNNSTLDNKLPISTTFFSFSSDSICCRSVCIVFY